MMESWVVGSQDCSINAIMIALQKVDNNYSILQSHWIRLARELDTPGSKICMLKNDLQHQRTDIWEVVSDLLVNWRQQQSNNAKFTRLWDILEVNCGWKSMADCLWDLFLKNVPENIAWRELDKRSQKRVMDFKVTFQGRLERLGNICKIFDQKQPETLLDRASFSRIIMQLLKGEPVSLVSDLVPELPPYYISRMLTTKRALDRKIFQKLCSDIFVVENISLGSLSDVAGEEHVVKASMQYDKITSRFVLLEFPGDFDRLTKIANKSSLHYLRFENERFYWVKSHGNLNLIQEYVHEDQRIISENDFLQTVREDQNHNLPVCIADIPGMGKTCLLASLAGQRKSMCGSDTLILFISLFDFFKNVNNEYPENFSPENVSSFIATFVTQNECDQRIITRYLLSDSCSVEIYFDGYDEVPINRLQFASSFLKCLTDNFVQVLVVVTTRVHRAEELERTLKVLSCGIIPLQRHDQKLFFQLYWSPNCDIETESNLERLADILVDKIGSTLSTNDYDLVGVPLQCYMLADIYKDYAISYSKLASLPPDLPFNVNSVHDMYSSLMKKRFGNFKDKKLKALQIFHVLEAVSTVFPTFFEENKKHFRPIQGHQTPDLEDINSVGILIAERVNNVTHIRYVHHTFAEYILADFLVTRLEDLDENLKEDWQIRLAARFYWEVVSSSKWDAGILVNSIDCDMYSIWKDLIGTTTADQLYQNWETLAKTIGISEGNVFAIREEINFSVPLEVPDEFRDPILRLLIEWTKNLKTQTQLAELVNALRHLGYGKAAESIESKYYRDDFQYGNLCFFLNTCLLNKQIEQREKLFISTYLSKIIVVDNSIGETFSRLYNLLVMCLQRNFSGLFNIIRMCCLNIRDEDSGVYKEFSWSNLLRVAARYSNVSLLKDCCEFVEEMEKKELKFPEVVESFVCTPLHVAAGRGDFPVFDYLCKKFRSSICEIKCLLHWCIEFSVKNSEQVINDKKEIIKQILKYGNRNLNEREHVHGRTPILVPAVHLTLLQLMITEGADINSVSGPDDNTVAHIATMYLSPDDLHLFLEFTVEQKAIQIFSKSNKYHTTAVHSALETRNIKTETIRLLSEYLGGDCFNNPDGKQDTELFAAVLGQCKMEMLKLIVDLRGNPKLNGKDKRTILHCAAISGNVEAMEYFISIKCCNVNAVDINGQTALHLAFILGRRHVDGIVKVLLKNGINARIWDKDGHSAFWHAGKDRLWMLSEDTLNLLRTASKAKPTYSNNMVSKIFRR